MRVIVIVTLLTVCLSEKHQQVIDSAETYSIPIDTPFQISLSLSRVFTLEITPPQTLLHFTPTTVSLHQTSRSYLPRGSMSLLEDIRSPFTRTYKSITILEDYMLLFLLPTTIVVIDKPDFTIRNTYTIPDENALLHKIGTNIAIGFFYGQNQAYILNQTGHYPCGQTIPGLLWIQPIENDQFLSAEGEKGVGHYQLQNGGIKLIRLYGGYDLGKKELVVTDLSVVRQQQNIVNVFILNSKQGVIEVRIDLVNRKVLTHLVLLIAHQCTAIDVEVIGAESEGSHQEKARGSQAQSVNAVISCSLDSASILFELTAQFDSATGTHRILTSTLPYFHSSYITDISISREYFMAYDQNAIDVFWGDTYGQIKGYSVQKIDMFQLECFTKIGNQLYVVKGSHLIIYELKEVKYSLTAESPTVISKTFSIKSEIDCKNYLKERLMGTCIYEKVVNVQFHGNISVLKEGKSMNIGIVFICVCAAILLMCLCCQKYQTMEKTAKKALEILRKKERKERKYQFKL